MAGVAGSSDKLLIYLTLYISACLRKLESAPTLAAGQKAVFGLAMEQFSLPGDAGWPLGGLFTPPANREEAGACCAGKAPQASRQAGRLTHVQRLFADALRAYLKQAREETGARLVPKCYTEDDKPNKFWLAFARRKFMNKEL